MSARRAVVLAAAVVLVCLAAPFAWAGSTSDSSAPRGPGEASVAADPTAGARQMLLVVAADWTDHAARMARYERAASGGVWRPVGGAFDVNVGRKGLGWGRGLHGAALGPGPVKREGDAKAPAGVFTVGPAFAEDPAGLDIHGLPVVDTSHGLVCVDDQNSARYNSLVDGPGTADVDWNSAEKMVRRDGQYRMGAFVDHNVAPRVPGGGSCIFLHIEEGPGKGTSGCTSMAEENLRAVLRWLDAKKRPVLVQLPRAEYERLRRAWNLPDIDR